MRFLRAFAAAAMLAISAVGLLAADAGLYAVGPFNGWDAKAPLPFEKEGDIYTITIDFSQSREFKMSTVSGATSQDNGWDVFDTGALKPTSTPALNEWIAIESNHSGNINAPESRTLQVQVDLTAMKMRFIADTTPAYSGTLPVLFINTENYAPVESKDTYLTATYYLDPMGCEGVQALGSKEAPLGLQIKGRGNYTWTGFAKKPYRLKFTDKAKLLGMNSSKHFVLLAHADDTLGFMRNTLGFATSETLGLAWTPAQRPVEVVLNGDYIGLYFATENIRVAKDRVNITEQADGATTDVDGGWLVEIDNYDSDPHVTVYEGSYPIWFTYKSPEVLSSEQTEYLQGSMQSIQDAITAKDYAAFSTLVDVDALARYYITQEVMNDYESFHGSCYLTRQRGASERWKFGPVWDFGSALFRDNDNRFILNGEYHQVWIGAIVAAFPQFTEVVKGVWKEFLEAGGPEAILTAGRSTAEQITKAAAANYRRWPDYGNADEMSAAEVAIRRLGSKVEWLREQWGDYGGIADAAAGDDTVTVSVSAGVLYVSVESARTLPLASIDGRVRMLHLAAGLNTIEGLPRGVYILAGHKILL